jgi:hypothetical protein
MVGSSRGPDHEGSVRGSTVKYYERVHTREGSVRGSTVKYYETMREFTRGRGVSGVVTLSTMREFTRGRGVSGVVTLSTMREFKIRDTGQGDACHDRSVMGSNVKYYESESSIEGRVPVPRLECQR